VANRSRRARTTEQVFYELFWFKEGIHMWPSLSETTWSTRSWPWSIPVPFSISAFEQGLRVLTPQPDPQSSMRLPSPPKPTPTPIDWVIATLLPFDLVLKEIRRRSRRSSSIRSIDVGRPPLPQSSCYSARALSRMPPSTIRWISISSPHLLWFHDLSATHPLGSSVVCLSMVGS
jgi:hypothetical protein